MCCDNCTKLCKCACKCDINSCSCEVTCGFTHNPISHCIISTLDSDSDSDESETGFSSESDFEGFIAKRPTVLQFSDDSDTDQ